MSQENQNIGQNPSVPELGHLWDQYKYRHELCWSAVYKVTVAVLALEVIPYVKDGLTKLLEYWMLVPPLVAIFFAAFGIRLVNNELAIFAEVKIAFHTLQNAFLETRMPDCESKVAAKHPISPATARHTRFDRYVHAFMIGLLILSVANTIFVVAKWIPYVMASPAPPTK